MFEMRTTPVTTTRRRALATSTSMLKSCGSLAFLLLFLLTVVANAHAATATTTTLSATPTSAPVGSSVTLTATVSPSAATGTVTFKSGTTVLGSCTLSAGTCHSAFTSLKPGANALTAVYAGNTAYLTSTSSDPTVTMTAVSTTTALKIGLAATPATAITTEPYGTSVTLTATVTGTGAAGTVGFTYGTALTGIAGCSAVTLSSGTATCTTSALPVATNESLKAVFTPTSSESFTTSTNATALAFAVTQITTTTALKIGLAATPNTVVTSEPYGTNVTMTATVTGTGAAGTVAFTYGSSSIAVPNCGAVTLSSGTAVCTIATLPVASAENLKAAFTSSNTADITSSSTATATAYAVTTATLSSTLTAALTSGGGSITSVASGVGVTLTASISPAAVAAGTVTFTDTTSSTTLCSAVAAPSGSATCATSALTTSGSNNLSAVFTPGTPANFSSATSTGTLALTVTKPAAATTMSVSAGPYYYGASVTLNAHVTPSAATGGTVTFSNGSTCTLASGTCQASTTTLPLGSDSLTATYGGDSTYAASPASTAVPVTVVVNTTHVAASAYQLDTTIPLVNAAVTYGTGFTLSATVTATSSVTPTSGHVSFYDGSTLLGYIAVNSSGVATLDSTSFNSGTPAQGKHYYIASYGGVYSGGAAEFSTSLSTAAPVTISQPTPLTITAASLSVTYGSTVPAITASYTGYVAPDTSTTLTTATKQPICTSTYTATSPVGTYPTSCSSAVDSNYTISYATGLVTVTGAAPTWSNFNAMTGTYGTAIPLAASTNSGGAITYQISSASHGGAQTTITSVPATYTPGTYYVTATVTAAGNYATASTQRTVTVNPAPLTITAFSPASIAFGSAVPTLNASNAVFSGFVGSDTQSSLTGTLTCSTDYTTISPPATYSTSCRGLTSSNYAITYLSGSFAVTAATPTITWPATATPIIYGHAQTSSTLGSCSATFNGSPVAGSCAWTTSSTIPHVGAAQSVTWTPSGEYAADYVPTTNASLSFGNVTAATLTSITDPIASSIPFGSALSTSRLTGGSVTYTLPATSAIVTVPGTFSWATSSVAPSAPGTSNVQVSFTPTGTNAADYNAVTNAGNASLTVTKATAPITTWPEASSINYGQSLSNSTLSGGDQGSLTGSFAWVTPTAVPAVGTDSESVIFTPTGASATLYTNATHTVSVVVNRETATVTSWPTASSIGYGQALSNSSLSGGTASVSGRFAWTNPINVPDVGGPAQNVTFTPTNTNYSPVSGTVNVTVLPATPTVSAWPTASAIAFGVSLNGSTLTGGTGSVAGNFGWTDNTVQPLAGTTSNSVTFTPNTINGMADYSNVIGWVNVVVNPCGYEDTINSSFSTAMSVYNASETPTPALPSPVVMDVEGVNQSAICAVNANASDQSVSPTTVAYPFITSGSVSSYPADSTSYGTNAAVLAYGTVATVNSGATVSITDDGQGDPGSISTSNDYSNGVFASMGGVANINDIFISTSGNFARALDATYEGTLNITNVQASSTGNNSATIMAGVGGGQVSVNGGIYSSSGTRSSGIRAAGSGTGPAPFSTVNVSDTLASTTIMAQNGTAVTVEGGNSVLINSTGGGIWLSAAQGDDHGIFLYQGTQGDATAGTGNFTMSGGSIAYTCDATAAPSCASGLASNDQNSPATLFAVANTTATISLTDVQVTNDTPYAGDANGTLLTVAALSQSGGTATFNAAGETLIGDVIVDGTSSATLNLAADTSSVPSLLTGAINAANSGGTVNLTLDATSQWLVADGTSYLTSLTNAGSGNISCQDSGQCTVYVNGVLQTGIN
ncbi:MAG TPA: Ig-like domain repeat protein [Terracidiphilus sp.]|nr:Ig-like domain repeat protein [Terracidiphilus sp.]